MEALKTAQGTVREPTQNVSEGLTSTLGAAELQFDLADEVEAGGDIRSSAGSPHACEGCAGSVKGLLDPTQEEQELGGCAGPMPLPPLHRAPCGGR